MFRIRNSTFAASLAATLMLCSLLHAQATPPDSASLFSEDQLEGQIYAPDFPEGSEWVNTALPISINHLNGKIVLIEFMNLSDAACRLALADVEKLRTKYANELMVVGVNVPASESEKLVGTIRQAVLREEITYPVVIDRDSKINHEYGITNYPTFVLVNTHGRVVGVHSGGDVYGVLDNVIAQTVKHFDENSQLSRRIMNFQTEISQNERTLLNFPSDVTLDTINSRLFICDSNNDRIIAANLSGRVDFVIGAGIDGFKDGSFAEAQFNRPQSLAIDGDILYISDTYNHAIRAANIATRTVSTVLDGSGPVRLALPEKLALSNGKLYIDNAGSRQVCVVDVKTFADAKFVDSMPEIGGNNVANGKTYEADRDNHQIRVIETSTQNAGSLHLTNLRVIAEQEMTNFKGREINFQPQNIQAGAGKISIAFAVPDGYELDQSSPFFVRYRSNDKNVISFNSTPEQLKLNPENNEFEISLVGNLGSDDVMIETVNYFHKVGSTICLYDVQRLNLPMSVIVHGPAMFGVSLNVRALPRP